MKLAYILVGVAGAGKSSIIRQISKNLESTTAIFSLDDCRHSFAVQKLGKTVEYSRAFDLANEHQTEFNSHVNAEWSRILKTDGVIFVDNTNLTRKSRKRWCSDLRNKGFTIWGVSVMVPLEVAVKRQSTRGDKSVPASVVRDMYYRQQELLVGDEVDFLVVVDGTASEPVAYSVIHLA